MKKISIISAILFIAGWSFFIVSIERIYVGIPVVYCTEYDAVYDARANVKDSSWYKDFDNNLVPFPIGHEGENIMVQFSHQFVTTRATADMIKQLQRTGKIPRENSGSIVQVCRVYYLMSPIDWKMISTIRENLKAAVQGKSLFPTLGSPTIFEQKLQEMIKIGEGIEEPEIRESVKEQPQKGEHDEELEKLFKQHEELEKQQKQMKKEGQVSVEEEPYAMQEKPITESLVSEQKQEKLKLSLTDQAKREAERVWADFKKVFLSDPNDSYSQLADSLSGVDSPIFYPVMTILNNKHITINFSAKIIKDGDNFYLRIDGKVKQQKNEEPLVGLAFEIAKTGVNKWKVNIPGALQLEENEKLLILGLTQVLEKLAKD